MNIRMLAVVGCLTIACAAKVDPSGVKYDADLVFLSGSVYTVDPQRPWAQAVAIRDGLIVYVGDDAIVAKLSACAASGSRRGDWLIGGGWSIALFPDGNAPKSLLDEISLDFPIALMDENGHAVWVNSKALALGGVDRNTPDPPAGIIERDPQTGEATGTLRESATALIYDHVPEASDEQLLRGARWAVARLHRAGVTSVVDAAVGEAHLRAYAALADAGELDLRVVACIEVGSDLIGDSDRAEQLVEERGAYRRKQLDPDCIKLFADGVLEGETAAMLEPYVGRPGYRGEPTFDDPKLHALVARFDALGLQVHVHAIGDAAVRSSLDAFEAARAANGPSDHRHNIAHVQLVHPDDVPRFAELGVIANFQFVWAYPDEYVTELNQPVIGDERMRWMYPIGSIHRAGGRIVLGTDWNVSPPDALPGIEVGLLRRDPTGVIDATLNENEGVDLATLIEAYTANGAFVMHQDDETGTIAVGKAADLVVLERNLFEIAPEEIGEVRVLETFVGGRTVYAAQ
jgi:predicted amidohydrolase YtcJ